MHPTTRSLLRAVASSNMERIATATRDWRAEGRPDLDIDIVPPLNALMIPILRDLVEDGDGGTVGGPRMRPSEALAAVEAGDEMVALRAAESIWRVVWARLRSDRAAAAPDGGSLLAPTALDILAPLLDDLVKHEGDPVVWAPGVRASDIRAGLEQGDRATQAAAAALLRAAARRYVREQQPKEKP